MTERNIEDICAEDTFSSRLEGTVYCTLGFTKPIMCPYHSQEKNHNDYYTCTHPLYNLDELEAIEQ